MALCLASSLLERGGFDAADQMQRYRNWYEHGYMSSTGTCFDIGTTVRRALERYKVSANPFSGVASPKSGGQRLLDAACSYPDVLLFGI